MTRRRLPAWLASLALLIHLLSMPLSGLLPADAKRLLGWSGHCPLMQAQVQQRMRCTRRQSMASMIRAPMARTAGCRLAAAVPVRWG